MNQNQLMGQSLKQIWLSQLLSIIGTVCSVVMMISAVGMAMAAVTGGYGAAAGLLSLTGVLVVAVLVLSILALVFYFMGLSKGSKVHPNFKNAIIVAIVFYVCNALASVLTTLGGNTLIVLTNLLSIISVAAGFLAVNYVCTAAAEMLQGVGDQITADRGHNVRKIYMLCALINIVCLLLTMIPDISTAVLGRVLLIVGAIAGLVGLFMYMSFLKAGSNSLSAAAV